MRGVIIALILVFAAIPTSLVSAETGDWSINSDDYKGVSISEILVSPNDAFHNGTDWNGDGEISSESDQYIQLTNDGDQDVDLSNWSLDDITDGGSGSCVIGDLTILSGQSITFYRADTNIKLDFFDGDSAVLIDSDGEIQSRFNYPANDSDYGKVYVAANGGTLEKADPNPSSTNATCIPGEITHNSDGVGEWSIIQNGYLGVMISEILVSSSSPEYDGQDLDGDGYVDMNSEQYIQLTNNGTSDVDISNWTLDDDENGGSPPCQIGYDTTISVGESITFYRSKTQIEFDYHDPDAAILKDTNGVVQSMIEYPAKDSIWDLAYILNEDGTLGKDDANPASRHGTCFRQGDVSESKYILQGRIVTMTGENEVIENGNIMIDNGIILAVWADGEVPPISIDGITIHDTDATIYPGLIDLHNHMHYNHIPLWDFNVHLNENQRSEEGGYTNRYQWGNNYDYKPSITWMKNNVQDYDRWDMASEQMKYAEVQAVAGGVTAVQGSPSSGTAAWDSMLSRNVEMYNFGQDGMYTCAVCGPTDSDYNANYIIDKNASGTLNAWFVHLSEGVDQSSKDEFDTLYDKGLIMDETVVIHGTPLDQSQFEKMGQKGAGLVWSPISNLLLYGDTTDVVAADNAGVTISLAPDWGPSGSKNNLHELKVADMWNQESLNGHFSDYELVEMVTSNGAENANWQSFVGQIDANMYADLVVVDSFHEDPYRNLIEAIDPDIRLTIVHGKAVFGDIDIMTDMKGDDWEYVNGLGFSKAVDVTSSSEVDGMQTWGEIESGLAMAMQNEFDDIKANWNDVGGMSDSEIEDWLATNFDLPNDQNVNHLKNLTLDPIFTIHDERYFDVINRSTQANYHIDMSKLYDYYDVEQERMTDPGNSNNNNGGNSNNNNGGNSNNNNGGSDPVEGCMDSTALNYNSQADVDDGSCTFEDDNGGTDNTGGGSNGGGICTGICDDDTNDDAKSEERDPIMILSIVMGLIFVLAISAIFISRENKNMNDYSKQNDSFVPEMPPLEPPKS